jgi:PAS domain S-box-containing protein
MEAGERRTRVRRATDDLQHDRESFQLLVDSVRDYAIFMLDPDGNVASWNEGARRIKGYEAEEIVGRHFSTFYPREAIDSDHPAKELAEAIREGRYEEEGWRLRKDGSRFWANVVITPLYDAAGNHRGFAKVTRDMTDRRRFEEELREAQAEIERRNVSKSHAVQINDDIVQALVVAHYALDRKDRDQAEGAVEDALTRAKKLVTDLLPENEDLDPGSLRRS